MMTAAPSVVVGIYRLCGIRIVAVTEHDYRLTEGGTVAEGNVIWRETEWQHSYDDSLLIRGFEASFPRDHVLVLGCSPADLPVESGAPGFIEAARQRGAFTVLNHPARWNQNPEHVIDDANLSICDALEVYSGGRVMGGAERAVAAPLWDACLSHGLKHFALGSSDCHTYDFAKPSRPTNGWNVLWLDDLTEPQVFDALRAGRFYASSGLEVDEVCVGDGRIAVKASQAERIRFIGTGGKLLREVTGSAADYEPETCDGYVRVELDGREAPFPGSELPIQAWLQPVWVVG